MQTLVDVSQVRAAMNAAHIGHDGNPDFVGLLGPEPFVLSPAEVKAITQSALATREWFDTTNNLYRQAIEGDENLWFVLDLVESEAEAEVVAWNRRVALSQRLRPPCFVRLDQPIPGLSVEAQVPGSGWGYRLALLQAFEVEQEMVGEFVAAVQALTGKSNPRIAHVRRLGKKFENEGRYFAEAVRAAGIDFRVYIGEVPDPKEVDLIIRHYFSDFLKFPGVEKAMSAYLAGEIEIDPPPSLITDQKVGLVLPFDPRTSGYYSDSVRASFPETHLVTGGAVEAVMNRPASDRNFVLKYAGLDPATRAQGKAVFNLSQCSRTRALNTEAEIVGSGRPWLLQRLLARKFTVLAEAEPGGALALRELYARFTPILAIRPDEIRLMCHTANFRNFWKVSSHHDSVLLPAVPE